MKKRYAVPIVALLLVACAATPIQRELQVARGIVDANDTTTMALDFDIISADTGEEIQVATRSLTTALKDAIAARRAGKPRSVANALLSAAEDALIRVIALIERRQKGK